MHLTGGHQGEVNDLHFSPNGQMLVSCGHDKTVQLWSVFGNAQDSIIPNSVQLRGHKAAVLAVHWSVDGARLFSAGADKIMAMWDVETRQRVRRFQAHETFIQAMAVSGAHGGQGQGDRVLTAGDDGQILMWDSRNKNPVAQFYHPWAVTSLVFNSVGDEFYVGSIDNNITSYSIDSVEPILSLQGHLDTVTSLALSPDGTKMLSNSADNTVRVWDIKPFSTVPNRLLNILSGAPHAFDKNLLKCCWNPDGSQVAAGSGDGTVAIWDVYQGKLEYKLPGHKGTVNCVAWHPTQPIIATGSVDRTIFLGEINPAATVYRQ